MEREKMRLGIILISCALLNVSCERKEVPAKPFDRGAAQSTTLKMGENYSNQLYFNLQQNRVVKQNSKMDWDFALSCDADPVIILNTSRNMLAAKTEFNDLTSLKDTSGLNLKMEMDFPSGNKDSLSVGRLMRLDKVFVIWLGYGLEGEDLGLIKIKFEAQGDGSVKFNYGKLKEFKVYGGALIPDDRFNHVFYSTILHQIADIEPLKTEYDLWFTQYLHFFLEPEVTPYLVAGALLNPHQVQAAKVFKSSLSEVTLSDTLSFPLTHKSDEIGYDWKRFSLNENTYTVVKDMNFIVKSQPGYFYRLKFTDFYDENGFRGAPSFIYELF